MKRKTLQVLKVALVVSLLASVQSPGEDTASASDVEKSLATVYITDVATGALYQGTGFVVSEDGVIATNFHVIYQKYRDESSPMVIMLGDRAFYGRVMSFDAEYDVALVKVEGEGMRPLRLSASRFVRSGDRITVVGNPGVGLMTEVGGLVSNVIGRPGLIQLKSPLYSGNSGSPVIDSRGRVVGIVTFSVEGEKDVNFALPIEYIRMLLDRAASLDDRVTNVTESVNLSGV